MRGEYNRNMKKENKNSNKKDAYSSHDLKRYLGALAETHNEHLKGIKEGFKLVDLRFDRVDKKFEEVDHRFDKVEEMLGTVMEDVSVLKDDMQIVKKELKKKVDYDEFLSLVQRVLKLEAKI